MRTLRPSRQEPIEEPIRAELFGIERLEQHAESLAIAQPEVPIRRSRRSKSLSAPRMT
jgi:hypothetical protein